MDWNALKLFLAIAESGSLAGAARRLGVNHSTVFRRLNTFEDSLGARLFERMSHGYELTPLGEEVLQGARTIAGAFDDLERTVAGGDIQPRGLVRITAPNNLAYRFLPRYLADFRQLYPDIQVELLVSNQAFNMNNRQADIAVRATPSPPQHLVGRRVRSIGWSVYGSKTWLDDPGAPRALEALQQCSIVGATGAMRELPAFVWLEKHLPTNIETRCDDLVAMSWLAQTSRTLALLPDDQQRPELEKLFRFEPGKTSELWLLTHPDLRHVERIKLVMQYLTTAFLEETQF